MRRMICQPAILASCAILVTGLLGTAGSSAMAMRPASSDAGRWHVVAELPRGIFNTVIAPGRASAWGFGGAVYRHWNGHRWSASRPVTSRKNSYVVCAAASSVSDVWAFTQAGGGMGNPPSSASALRLRNGRWVGDKVWTAPAGTYITGCNVLSPDDVWAFGGAIAGLGPAIGTWHRTRSGWTQLNTGHLVLFDASVVSPRDLWAAGVEFSAGGAFQPALGRWNGTRWTQDRSILTALPKNTRHSEVVTNAVNAISDRDVWVQAFIIGEAGVTGVAVVHWDGTRWSRVKPGSMGYYLPTAVPDGHGGWWSAPYNTRNSPVTRYLLHEQGARWTRSPLPGPLYTYPLSLAHVPHSQAALAAGSYQQTPGTVLAYGTLPH